MIVWMLVSGWSATLLEIGFIIFFLVVSTDLNIMHGLKGLIAGAVLTVLVVAAQVPLFN